MERRVYKCKDCGHEFEVEVLSMEEREEMIRKNNPFYPIVCEKCKSKNIIER